MWYNTQCLLIDICSANKARSRHQSLLFGMLFDLINFHAAEPFYICVADSTQGSTNNRPEVTDPVAGSDAVDSAAGPETVSLVNVAGGELADTTSATQETVEVIETAQTDDSSQPEAGTEGDGPIVRDGDTASTTEETNHARADLSDEDVQPITSSGIPTGSKCLRFYKI